MYRSSWNGQRLTLAASGWTWNETFVLYDLETGSLWVGADTLLGPIYIGGGIAEGGNRSADARFYLDELRTQGAISTDNARV